MIMPDSLHAATLIAVIAVISFGGLIASNVINFQKYPKQIVTIYRAYFTFGLLGWVFFSLSELLKFNISVSWLAISYFLAVYMLLFIITEKVNINPKTVLWTISNIVFIAFELITGSIENQLWIFTIYVLIHMFILGFIAYKNRVNTKNIGYDIIVIAVITPFMLAGIQLSLLLINYDLHFISGLGIVGAATSYSMVSLGFVIMTLIIEKNSYASQAYKDPLTGLYNRRGLSVALDHLIAQCQREMTYICAITCDIDFFKKINDTHGHDAGDLTLKKFAETLITLKRETDIIARVGGEEFVIFLSLSNCTESLEIAERIRKKIEELEVVIPNNIINITASFGIAYTKSDIDIDGLIKDADKALYRAKDNGRNQVCLL